MIRKRSKDSWQIRVELGLDPLTQKRKQAYVSFRGTRREAEAEERRLLRERDTGGCVHPEQVALSEFLDRWLADVKNSVRATTHDRYEAICRLHVKPKLGHLPLSKLRPLHLQNLYSAKLEPGGAADGKGTLSKTSVLHLHRVLHEALAVAVRLQLIPSNPADAVRPPRPVRPEMKVLTEAETGAILKAAQGTPLYYPILIAATTGLRRGELLGLRWGDVDLETGTVSVRQSLQCTSRGLAFTNPKTTKSRRTVALPPLATKALKEHRAAQSQERLLRGREWVDHDLVFCAGDGRPWNPSTFSNQFHDFTSKSRFPIRFHDLRHTHATQLFRAGVHPKMVSERLGHSNVGITLDQYTHVVEGMDREAAERINARLTQAGVG